MAIANKQVLVGHQKKLMELLVDEEVGKEKMPDVGE
jgi:hypothetical protein